MAAILLPIFSRLHFSFTAVATTAASDIFEAYLVCPRSQLQLLYQSLVPTYDTRMCLWTSPVAAAVASLPGNVTEAVKAHPMPWLDSPLADAKILSGQSEGFASAQLAWWSLWMLLRCLIIAVPALGALFLLNKVSDLFLALLGNCCASFDNTQFSQ